MGKILTALLSIALVSICFTGCNRTAPPIEQSEDIKPSIVTTIFPAYDFAKQVCGDNGNVTMLLRPGTGGHSYKPSPKDIIKTQNSDLLIYVGGESDAWVDEIILSMDQPIRLLKMIDYVNVVDAENNVGVVPPHHGESAETEIEEEQSGIYAQAQ